MNLKGTVSLSCAHSVAKGVRDMKCGHYASMQIRYQPSDDYYVCWDGRCLFCQVAELQTENKKLKEQIVTLNDHIAQLQVETGKPF